MAKRNCVLIALLLVACGGEVAEERSSTVAIAEPDAQVVETPEPAPVECWCCTWKPGTSYPDGVSACARGETVMNICDASPVPGAEWPEWAPSTVSCSVDDPWGKNG